jgi:hypothetical protein
MAKFARRFWPVIPGVAVLVLAACGFLVYGPVGLGHGPLSVAFVDSDGTIPRLHPVVVLIPIATDRSNAAVIDAVGIDGGDGYPPPRMLSVLGDRTESCSGIWYPVRGGSSNSFARHCAPGGTVPLVGRAVPVSTAIEVAVEVGAPGLGKCWSVGRVSVRYHVGHRHYTAVSGESISGCAGPTRFARQRRTASSPQGWLAAGPAGARR